jgi:ElaB/YqjD/DUF883 family membrane-anchored ribosome-binding protein
MATRSNVQGAVASAREAQRDAVEAVRDVRDNVADAIDKSVRDRPYATLALAVGLGFIVGAIWRG